MSDQAINLSPILETFATDGISMSELVKVGCELTELMLESMADLREHLQTIEPGRYTVGQVRNGQDVYSVKVAALDADLPTAMRGMRVTNAQMDALQSFVLFADQPDGTMMPIDFDIID